MAFRNLKIIGERRGITGLMVEEGIYLRLRILVLLILFVLIGMAAADYAKTHSVTFNMEQSVQGDGYFMNYKAVRMPNSLGLDGERNNGVEARDYSHGSGSIDTESLLTAEASNRTEGGAEDAELMDYQEALSCIQMDEDAKLAYSSTSIGIGTGFYALHPISFSSLLKEETGIKNRGGASSNS
jgi:hypothetical protein